MVETAWIQDPVYSDRISYKLLGRHLRIQEIDEPATGLVLHWTEFRYIYELILQSKSNGDNEDLVGHNKDDKR